MSCTVLFLHILCCGRSFTYLVYLGVFFVLWVRQLLSFMLLQSVKLSPWQKCGTLLLNQVSIFLHVLAILCMCLFYDSINLNKLLLWVLMSILLPCSVPTLCGHCTRSSFRAHIPFCPTVWPDTHHGVYWCLFSSRIFIGMNLTQQQLRSCIFT